VAVKAITDSSISNAAARIMQNALIFLLLPLLIVEENKSGEI
jgi:hypothetical protein